MKAKLRNAWAFPVAVFIAILTTTSGVVAASSASATTSTSPTKTCTFAHGHLGPTHYAIDTYTKRKLAWTGLHSSPGQIMNLEPYHDTLKQCWHIISGFGHGEFEIQISTGKSLCITQNSTTHGPGVPLELEACLSKKTQLWVDYGTDKSRSRFELVAHPKLCIASDTKVQSGAVLYQENCNNSSPRQHWFINTSP